MVAKHCIDAPAFHPVAFKQKTPNTQKALQLGARVVYARGARIGQSTRKAENANG